MFGCEIFKKVCIDRYGGGKFVRVVNGGFKGKTWVYNREVRV